MRAAAPASPPDAAASGAEFFTAKITPALRQLIDPADPRDPIAAQFMPSEAERHVVEGERADPIGDDAYQPVPGIVHRYPDRVLLKLLHSCAVHCRFCFRREQIGAPDGLLSDAETDAAIAYIEQKPDIWEVILTGGDPLLLAPRRLAGIVARLNAIGHVKIIRAHTRIPVADPARVTPELVEALKGRAAAYVLLHCNHPRELTAAARAACAAFIDRGVPMLSQSVLLRGVNDHVDILVELMRAFVESRVTPHYLHHGDLARGTAHFRVPLRRAQDLLRAMRGHVSGLCQPHYMLDIPGGHGKSPIGPVYARAIDDSWIIQDYRGESHVYRDLLASKDSPA